MGREIKVSRKSFFPFLPFVTRFIPCFRIRHVDRTIADSSPHSDTHLCKRFRLGDTDDNDKTTDLGFEPLTKLQALEPAGAGKMLEC